MANLNSLPIETLHMIIGYIPRRPFHTELLLLNKDLCSVFMIEQVKKLEFYRDKLYKWIELVTDDDIKSPCSIPLYSNLLDKIYKVVIYIDYKLPEEAYRFFSRCTNLHKLACRSYNINYIGPIFDSLASNIIEMEFLNLRIGDKEESVQSLVEYIRRSTKITKLSFRGSRFSNQHIQALGECLKLNSSIANLNLYGNDIHAEGAHALAETLKQNTTLTNLTLSWNDFCAEGAHAMAEALKQNTTLTNLNLAGNSIKNEGAHALAEALKQNTALTSLDISYNGIDNEGAHALAKGLMQNTTLINLEFRCNYFGNDAARALVEGLKYNTTLTDLNIESIQEVFATKPEHYLF